MGLDDILFFIGHASFYIKANGATVFIDPFRVSDSVKERADLVLITHAHFDHCSKGDINKVAKDDAKIIAAPRCLNSSEYKNLTVAEPGFRIDFHGMGIEAVPAYNVDKEKLHFHPKSNRWVGYIVTAENMRIYHAGDTDLIPEMKAMKGIDAALLPMGGTYVMDVDEMIEAEKAIRPKMLVPMHYKNLLGVEGSKSAEERLKRELSNLHIMKEVQEPTYSFDR